MTEYTAAATLCPSLEDRLLALYEKSAVEAIATYQQGNRNHVIAMCQMDPKLLAAVLWILTSHNEYIPQPMLARQIVVATITTR